MRKPRLKSICEVLGVIAGCVAGLALLLWAAFAQDDAGVFYMTLVVASLLVGVGGAAGERLYEEIKDMQ